MIPVKSLRLIAGTNWACNEFDSPLRECHSCQCSWPWHFTSRPSCFCSLGTVQVVRQPGHLDADTKSKLVAHPKLIPFHSIPFHSFELPYKAL